MSHRVFISYRRDGVSEYAATWLHSELATELSPDEVFLDKEEVTFGAEFPKRIQEAVESAPAFLALIDGDWNPVVEGGRRRLDEPANWVRREVELALEQRAADPRRLLLPVLLSGATMPEADTLPASLRPLLIHNAASFQPGPGLRQGVEQVVATVVEHLEEFDETPEEEKWILRRISGALQDLNRSQVAAMGSALSTAFPPRTSSPKSVRAVARTIYAIGPDSLECLLALGESGERIGRLITLLATYWIKADVARALRTGLTTEDGRQPIAIACEYPDFTADEALLKASYREWGWPTVVVKPADPALEIVQQVHEKLAAYFNLDEELRQAGDPSGTARENREREMICRLLAERKTRAGRELPLVLFADHGMGLDPNVFVLLNRAFPALRFLVATSNPGELRAKHPSLIVLQPSDSVAAEKEAYDAFKHAKGLLAHTRERQR